MKITTQRQFIPDEEMAKMVERNKHIYDAYFDPEYAVSLERNIFRHLDKHYFRCRFIGFDPYPERNNPDHPLIFVSNHSGMAFPWDAIMFGSGLFKMNDHDFSKSVRILVAAPLIKIRLMNAFLVKNFWRRAGGVKASTLNFETMMQYRDSNLMVYPEGVPGIGKGFNKRYQLQRFATSFVRMSIKYKTDVIPILTINGEYINPYVFSLRPVNRLVQMIGIPFLPVGLITLLLPFCPWLFYFAFPARLTYVMGTRIKPYEMINKAYEDIELSDIQEIRDRIQKMMQKEMDAAVKKYGQHPYRIGELLRNNIRNLHRMPFFNAPGWPLLFAEHERRYTKNKAQGGKRMNMKLGIFSIFQSLVRNPLSLTFFIPILGWIPIFLLGYRKDKTD